MVFDRLTTLLKNAPPAPAIRPGSRLAATRTAAMHFKCHQAASGILATARRFASAHHRCCSASCLLRRNKFRRRSGAAWRRQIYQSFARAGLRVLRPGSKYDLILAHQTIHRAR